jgi:glycosyltransferase involved in cell wall biosynthesis
MTPDIDIIIPIFNEKENIKKLISLFDKDIKSKIIVTLCYDSDDDDIFEIKDYLNQCRFEIKFIKNQGVGPCLAVKTGLKSAKSECMIVYPADDFLNTKLIDKIYEEQKVGADIVVCSRFIHGGSMEGCPLIKSILVRTASFTLYWLSSIPVQDASNGLRMFSRKVIDSFEIESKLGFAYSLELLVKSHRYGLKIVEIPALWEERSVGSSNFKVLKWIKQYIKWYLYGLASTWLFKKK